MSTTTPSTFDLYGSQIDQLMPIYQQELGRGLQDPEALAYYGDKLKSGAWNIDEVRANIASSLEGQQHITPAEQAAIDAQNSSNLGFGATTGGNGADDAAQLDAYNKFISDSNIISSPYGTQFTLDDYDNDLTNVFTGASDYLKGFATEMTKVLDNSLVGKIANTLEGQKTSAALVEATGAPKEDINLALEVFSTGSEVVKAAFKLTPFGALVAAYVPSLGQSTLNTNIPVTDLSTSVNDNNVTVTPYVSGSDNKTDNNTNSSGGVQAGQTDYGLY
jgi:hypothetical protein